jgi:aminomethyltransferase
MDAATTPLEAGLGWLVHLEMPKPFVGRQILEQQSKEGVKRRLVGLKLSSKAIPRAGYSLFLRENDSGSEPIGQVSSGGWSPTLNAGIALAHVAMNAAKIGTELEVEIRGKRILAVVTRKQFIGSALA